MGESRVSHAHSHPDPEGPNLLRRRETHVVFSETAITNLAAEIDLPNPEDLLRSGMYAHAAIQIERANVLTLPASAVATQGDVNEGYRDYCFLLEDGKLQRTWIEVGSR